MGDLAGYALMDQGFMQFGPAHGALLCRSDSAFPSKMASAYQDALTLPAGATHYGYVYSGETRFSVCGSDFSLSAGMYFAIPDQVTLHSSGLTVVFSRQEYCGMFQVGGAIEPRGRLCYIDGCTDSLLVAPPLKGDACLNLLHFPAGIDQTPHTHPSDRLGIVARGRGICRTPHGEHALLAGNVFCIPAEALHSFATNDSDMTVIAYHPDSDFGPTHEAHPMINRTIVNGVSASQLIDIRTVSLPD